MLSSLHAGGGSRTRVTHSTQRSPIRPLLSFGLLFSYTSSVILTRIDDAKVLSIGTLSGGKRTVTAVQPRPLLSPLPFRIFLPEQGVYMSTDRDVERNISSIAFAALLRRVADAVESDESFRIQVVNKRFTVPKGAELSVEHEAEDGDHELEFQFRWTDA